MVYVTALSHHLLAATGIESHYSEILESSALLLHQRHHQLWRQRYKHLTLFAINFNVLKKILQSHSTSMYRKLDFSYNKLQCAEEITSVPFHFNVPKTWLQFQQTSMCWRNYFSPIPLQCTVNLTSIPTNFNVLKKLLQSHSTSMYCKLDSRSNTLQYTKDQISAPDLPMKLWLQVHRPWSPRILQAISSW